MGDASGEGGSSLDHWGLVATTERSVVPLKPDEGIALEAECREAYKLGEVAETTARLVQARALYTLRETLGVHPQTGEVVSIWALGPDGCESWSQYCWDALGVNKSRASWLCSVWEVYHVRLGYSEETLQEIPVTKLKEPLSIIRGELASGEVPDEELMDLVMDPEVTTRQLSEACREKRGQESYRVWWGEYDGFGRDLLLSGPNGDILCGRLTLKRMNGASDEEWDRVLRWAKSI